MAKAEVYRSVLWFASSCRHLPLLPVEYRTPSSGARPSVVPRNDGVRVYVWNRLLEMASDGDAKYSNAPTLCLRLHRAAFNTSTLPVHVLVVELYFE